MFDTDVTWFKEGGVGEGVTCVATCWIGVLCGTLPGWGAGEGVEDVGIVWFSEFIPSVATEEGGALLDNEEGTSEGFADPVDALLLAAVLGAEPTGRGWAMLLQLLSTIGNPELLLTTLETGAAGVRWLE